MPRVEFSTSAGGAAVFVNCLSLLLVSFIVVKNVRRLKARKSNVMPEILFTLAIGEVIILLMATATSFCLLAISEDHRYFIIFLICEDLLCSLAFIFLGADIHYSAEDHVRRLSVANVKSFQMIGHSVITTGDELV